MAEIIVTVTTYMAANLTDLNVTNRATHPQLGTNWVLMGSIDAVENNKNYFPLVTVNLMDESQDDILGMGQTATIDTTRLMVSVFAVRDYVIGSVEGMEICRTVMRDIVDTITTNWRENISVTDRLLFKIINIKPRPYDWDKFLYAMDAVVEVKSIDAGS